MLVGVARDIRQYLVWIEPWIKDVLWERKMILVVNTGFPANQYIRWVM
jgi:hypothetical protein